MKINFDVVVNTDDGYMQHCAALVCSLYENNKEHAITLHVMERGLSDENKTFLENISSKYGNSCRFYSIDESKLEGVQLRNVFKPLSKAAYFRILMGSTLPVELDLVLYLDCDIVVVRDISELFRLELDGYALAAVRDGFPKDANHRSQLNMSVDDKCFCSGVMLINLKYWRENGAELKLLEFAKRPRQPIYLQDQDALNCVFRGKWFQLPPKWNRFACRLKPPFAETYRSFDLCDYVKKPAIIHFAGCKVRPWNDVWSLKRKVYFDYLKMSGFGRAEVVHLSLARKIKAYRFIVRELTDFYVLPKIPMVIMIPLRDLGKILRFFICLFRKRSG